MKNNSKITIGSITIIIVIIISYLYYIRAVEIDKQYNSVIYSFENEFEKETIISIKGKLYRKPFSKDSIVGKLTVDNDLSYDFILKGDGHKYFFLMTEYTDEALLRSIGTITVSKNLDKVWLMLKEVNSRYDIDGYVFGPADDKEEANELIKEMMDFRK